MIHGDGVGVRPYVAAILKENPNPKLFKRYALCGTGDKLASRDGAMRVINRGCQHKCCPRCFRQQCRKFVKRVLGWLANAPHGDLWAHCITQPVKKGESLKEARARMDAKVKTYLKAIKGYGIHAGIGVCHIVWSQGHEGWHVHWHWIIERKEGEIDAPSLHGFWADACGPEFSAPSDRSASRILPPGPAMPELCEDNGQVDFWTEGKTAASKAIQYPLRDLAQGLSAWRFGGDPVRLAAATRELVEASKGWKVRRTIGRWRKKPPEPEVIDAPKEEEPAGAEVVAAPAGKEVVHGSPDRIQRRARKGCVHSRQLLAMLEASIRNNSDFGTRVVRFCRIGLEGQMLQSADIRRLTRRLE